MQPLAEPLLRDAAPEPPAGTARLLLTSHVLTKFGSKAWEVRITTPAHPAPAMPWVATPAHASPAVPCALAKPAILAGSLQRRCCCSSSARATSLRPPSSASRSSCSRCDGGGPPRTHPALPVVAAVAFVLASTTAFCPRLHPALHAYTRLALHTHVRMPSLAHPLSVDPSYPPLVPSSYPPGALLVPSSYPPRTLLPVYLRADVRQLDG